MDGLVSTALTVVCAAGQAWDAAKWFLPLQAAHVLPAAGHLPGPWGL